MIDSDVEAVKDMLEYLRQHRTWLPSKKGPKIRRDQAETEIRKWGVDKGLARPSVLTTKLAQDFQKILNSEPTKPPMAPDTPHWNKLLQIWKN